MTAPILTRAVEDYLKAAYRLQREDGLATTRRLSQALGLSDASVTKMSKRLHRAELVCHSSYHGVVLTKEGIHLASRVLRHHRLIAMYLVEALGYSWDKASQEAERLEHHLSDQLVARMDAFLGYPAVSDELDDCAAPDDDAVVAYPPADTQDTSSKGAS